MSRITRQQLQSKVDAINKALSRPLESWRTENGSNQPNKGNYHIDSYRPGAVRIFSLREHKQTGEQIVARQFSEGAKEFDLFLSGVLAGIEACYASQDYDAIKYALQYIGKGIADGAFEGCVISPDFLLKRLERMLETIERNR